MFKEKQTVWCLLHGKGKVFRVINGSDAGGGFIQVRFERNIRISAHNTITYTIDGRRTLDANVTVFPFEPQVIHKLEPMVIPHETDLIAVDKTTDKELHYKLCDAAATKAVESDAIAVLERLCKEPLIKQLVAYANKPNIQMVDLPHPSGFRGCVDPIDVEYLKKPKWCTRSTRCHIGHTCMIGDNCTFDSRKK